MDILWTPTPKQAQALRQTAFEILYGGARGGGKTDAGLAWFLYDIDKPRFRGLVIRRNADDLSDWVDRARQFYRHTGAEVVGKPAEIRFPTGAIIKTGHLKDENAYEKYQGHEYHRMLVEELTHIPREQDYIKLISSCRSTVEGVRAQIFCTTNPGNAGHNWVRRRFIEPSNPGQPFIGADTGRERVFISATVEDNPHLVKKDPEYIRYLDGLPEALRKQWREGSWDDLEIEGAYYGALIRQGTPRITRVQYDESLPVHTAMDIGIGDACAIWYAQIYGTEIRLIRYEEYRGEGLPQIIKAMKAHDYDYGTHYAPHDIGVREFGSGVSRLETAQDLGVNFVVVPKLSVDDGIDAVRRALPRCWFDRELCERGIDGLRHYRKEWSDKRNDWLLKPVHDWASHPADAFRYLIIGIGKGMDPSWGGDIQYPERQYA